MSKNKKKRPAAKPQPRQLSRPEQKMNNGSNRQQKREEARAPQRVTSHKPLWLRIMILVILAVMFLGFFLFPLMR
jgi:hypothetical protein